MLYDPNNYFKANPLMRLPVLSDADVAALHDATVRVLEDTGIRVESEEAAKLLASGGAAVTYDEQGAIAKIPEKLLSACIASAPKDAVFHGRPGGRDFHAGEGCTGFSPFGECVKILDPGTGEARDTTKEDLGRITRIADYFPEIAVVERACGSLDKPASVQALHNLEVMVLNTGKPIFIGAMNGVNAGLMIEMARAVCGGDEALRARPFLNFFICPVSPLALGRDCCDIAMEAGRAGVGVATIPMPLAGATAPVTLAGTVVDHNCEALSSLVLHQLAGKGAPFFYCSMSTIMDLRHMIASTGAPEHPLMGAATVRMAAYYGLPSWIGAGISDSKLPDAQTGYEFGIGTLLGALAGVNVIYGAGALESGLLTDYAKLVMDCEALTFVRRVLDGLRVDEEEIALELIQSKGPLTDFLREKHTFRHMREQVPVTVFDRQSRDTWLADGGRRAEEKAYARAQEILQEHEAPPVPEAAREAMARIIAGRERALGL
ncbi:MAG: trimethylamine methyltransferase family protein [Clostridiales Family XIII bacterium]|jgi:trimethylamine--corrinoid protein Co-methyltransferase|nr:trimethylamine methyltransferase family protein [Clostridiales Family XIII bacterium]